MLSNMSDRIEISKDDFIELKGLYKKASEEQREQFVFKSKILLTSYAKYLVEYFESKFDKK
jgi:hypothetical protein